MQQQNITTPRAGASMPASQNNLTQNRPVMAAVHQLHDVAVKLNHLERHLAFLIVAAIEMDSDYSTLQAIFDEDQRPGDTLNDMSVAGAEYWNILEQIAQTEKEIEEARIVIGVLEVEISTKGGVVLCNRN